ncbi:hypothetical protein [Caecibacteroides pullorum]|nr:hypothetical protein [Caecibacteroides pullorum]
MKTRNFLWTLPLAAVTLVMAACSNDEIIGGESQLGETVKMTFTADAPQTRTILLPVEPSTDWRGVEWQLGDAISVFDKNNANNCFGNYDEDDLGKFSGTAVESDSYIAVYPYNKQMVCNGKTISGLSLPFTQEAVAGTFAQNLSLAWAQTTSGSMFLEFHHLCAVVKFSIFGQEAEQVETVTLTDNAQKTLGYDKFGIVIQGEGEEEQASLNERGESFSSIVLNAPEGGFVSGSDYYFVILPDKEQAENAPFQSGLTLSFKMKDGNTIEKRTDKAIEMNVGEIANLGSISLEEKKITNKELIDALENVVVYPETFDKDENGFVPITGKNEDIIAGIVSMNIDNYYPFLTDLSGIEYLSNLEYLYCSQLEIESLDVSSLKKLKQLRCNDNPDLKTLNVSGLTNLETLECSNTGLTSLDVRGLENLQQLLCENSKSLSLTLGTHLNLIELSCNGCNLSSLDVSSFTALEKLDCGNNQNLKSLTLGNLSALTYLMCYRCQLSTLDVSGLTNLSDLDCAENKLSELDLRKNENLTSLYCGEQVDCNDDNKMRLYLPESLVDMWNNDWESSSRYVELVTE